MVESPRARTHATQRLILPPPESPTRDVTLKEVVVLGDGELTIYRVEGRGLRSGVLVWLVFALLGTTVRVLEGNTSADAFPALFDLWSWAPDEPWLTEAATFATATGIGVQRPPEERGGIV